MKGGVKHGLFLRIEEFARIHYRRVFLATLLLVLGSIYLGSKLSLDGDVLSLLPRENRRINTFRQALRDFGGLDYLLVVVEARKGQSVEDLQEFADLLSARLQKVPSIRYVEHRIDTSGPFFDFFRRNEILFLPPAKLPELAAKFTDDAIRQRVRDNARQLSGPSSILVKRVLQEDPFWISPLLLQEVLRSKGPLKVDLESGYYLSRDSSALLLIAKPIRPAQDVDFSRDLLDAGPPGGRRGGAGLRRGAGSGWGRKGGGGAGGVRGRAASLLRRRLRHRPGGQPAHPEGHAAQRHPLLPGHRGPLRLLLPPRRGHPLLLDAAGGGAVPHPGGGLRFPAAPELRHHRLLGHAHGAGHRLHHRHVRPVRGGAPGGAHPAGGIGPDDGEHRLRGLHRRHHFGRDLLRHVHHRVQGAAGLRVPGGHGDPHLPGGHPVPSPRHDRLERGKAAQEGRHREALSPFLRDPENDDLEHAAPVERDRRIRGPHRGGRIPGAARGVQRQRPGSPVPVQPGNPDAGKDLRASSGRPSTP